MGWASGSMLAEEVWLAVKPNLKEGTEQPVAKAIIKAFEAMDCDTLDEVPDLVRTAIKRRAKPTEAAPCKP